MDTEKYFFTIYKKAFTLIELLVVILMVGILASVAVPILRGRIDKAKWSEAKATAGTIRRAVQLYAVENGVDSAKSLAGSVATEQTLTELGLTLIDLTGNYFVPGDYNIDFVNEFGFAQITITASTPKGPTIGESIILTDDGQWQQG